MERSIVQTDQAPSAIGPYSQAIAAPPWLFVSGQLGMNPWTGELVGDRLEDQARQAIENLLQIVRAGGGDAGDVVAVDVFVTDMGGFADFNAIYEEYFGAYKPARAVVEVSALPKGACVEIKCIAHIRT
ncbi:RidA family protein [Desulfonema ishimotonii]|uniref:RidA family protein n=1 Tax=Desulfonema ishimotonii TaxID=45657 RepID=A0A401G393_9BACT|nr:Rid family detoxifying hydrolase [Desulfonema ishimotonii]GBC63700.1 RidA family protein [Desulfonema ishimotonii]